MEQHEEVKTCWRDLGVGLGYFLLIVFASALQFYKQETLRETSPVAFAAMVKTIQGILFLMFIAGKSLTATGIAPLFDHPNRINSWVLGSFIAILCVMGAITLALDNIAFIYLDLTTKQVIDSMSPAAMLIVSAILLGLLDTCKPANYTQMERQEQATTHRTIRSRMMTSLKALLITAMVCSSVWVVWATPEINFFGVTINGISLLTSAIGAVLLETILKWKAYSDFGLMIWTIIPEVVVLSVISWVLGEAWPKRIFILHASIVSIVETGLKVLVFYLLRRTSAVDLSVSGVMVFAIVVAGDTIRVGKPSTMRIVALSATFLFTVGYSLIVYYGRRRELRLEKEAVQDPVTSEWVDPVLGTPVTAPQARTGIFGLGGFAPLDGHRGGFGASPALSFFSHQKPFGSGIIPLELQEDPLSINYVSVSSGDTEYSSGDMACSDSGS